MMDFKSHYRMVICKLFQIINEKWRWQCIMALNHLMNFLFSTIAPRNREEIGLPKGLEDIHTESQSQNVQKLKQQIDEGRPTSENDKDDDAHKPCRELRKRIAKCGTDQIEVGRNDERGIDNFNVSQMDGNRSDEDMPKPKRTKRKSKRQTNDIEKPTRKHKKAFVKPDSVVENSPKKKFPHATRRRRRQVNKVLLQSPEDEIDLRQISIRDLIMLAEAKERIARKETAAMSKLFSGQRWNGQNQNGRMCLQTIASAMQVYH
ncbi:uncharacterized protein LOC108952056 isoform X2 [Musa acuminata AAA Group]|uniref:uncharacterized protein LOC108952056 isoform X2 n=1 Tax=Musa acuminata AAA Group TaxID=214697 RepID=UPI0031E12FAE